MRKQRWLPKPLVKAIDPTSSRLLSKERKKHKKELEEVRRLEYNSRRREERMEGKLRELERESQAKIEETAEAAEERYEGTIGELRRDKESLKKNLARLNARVHREPLKIQHAVQRALEHETSPDAVLPTVRYIKDKQGVVQDWARNAIITLVNEEVPISKTWSVMKVNAAALGVTVVGKWSTRTSGRVVREGSFAAGFMIVEYVLTCIGPSLC
jgi:hypothetical protein